MKELKENWDPEEFTELMKKIFPVYKQGLRKGKCLYKDGLLHLEEQIIERLQKEDGISDAVIVYLAIMTKAFPKEQARFENDENGEPKQLYEDAKTLRFLITLAGMQKKDLLKVEYGLNKLKENHEFKIQLNTETEIFKIMHEHQRKLKDTK